MGAGEEPVKKTSRASMRLLGSVGEPIHTRRPVSGITAWWATTVAPIVDTGADGTGGIMITPAAGRPALKPGSATALLRRRARGGRTARQVLRERPRAISSSPIHARPECAPVFGDHERS